MEDLKQYIKTVPDFPVEGILYRDIQPLLANKRAFEDALDIMTDLIDTPFDEIDYVVGIEARGFIVGAALAWLLNTGFKMIRKPGKLPGNKLQRVDYKYEYSQGSLEMEMGEGKVIIIDDVYATGGTMEAAEELANGCGYDVIDKICLLDIGLVKDHDVKCVITYE